MKKIIYLAIILLIGYSSFAQRISIRDGKFSVNNENIWLNGTNTPWDKWNDFGGNFNYDWWENEFQELHDLHINCTRVWITCNGENKSININKNGYIEGVTQQFWDDVDQLMKLAKEKQIYVMIALISFDHSKPENPNAAKWINMYNSEANRKSFVDNYAVPFVNRYKDNPYFFAVDAGNELEWVWENHDVDMNNVLNFISKVVDGVKSNSDVLVCQGLGTGIKYNSSYKEGKGNYMANIDVDFYNIHFYDWQNPYFGNPFDLTPTDYKMDSKPCIIGEAPAKGAAGYSPKECYKKAYENGWQGLMVWTSNGVDNNGNKQDSKPGTDYIFEKYQNRIN